MVMYAIDDKHYINLDNVCSYSKIKDTDFCRYLKGDCKYSESIGCDTCITCKYYRINTKKFRIVFKMNNGDIFRKCFSTYDDMRVEFRKLEYKNYENKTEF